MRRSGATLTVSALAILAACGVASETVGDSTQHHTEGQPTWSNSPYQWGQIGRDEADAKDVETRGKTAPVDHVVSVRLQAWLDRYDAIVREIVKTKTGQTLTAPKPEVRLHAATDINAWIAMDPMCIAKATTPDAENEGLQVLSAPNMTMGGLKSCFAPKNWEAKSGLEFFNGLDGPLKVMVTPTAIEIGSELRANEAAIMSAVPFVNINSALVAKASEKTTAVILAHELGHYY
ncbi:MAG TPA: hypothetical protein VM925_03990, partial [Labilithrix sp.]|nr:hypothetical protein [Labilithrix sp.]